MAASDGRQPFDEDALDLLSTPPLLPPPAGLCLEDLESVLLPEAPLPEDEEEIELSPGAVVGSH